MQYIVIIVLMIIGGLVSCATDKTATLGITGNEFLENYNEEVPNDLKVSILPEGEYVALGPLFGLISDNQKYTIGCSYHRGKLRHIALNYIYSLEPEQSPTAEGKATMEKVCIAAIDAVDDGWFTNEKNILKACGFYSNSMDSKWHEKDGICYLMFDNGICWGLRIRSKDDTGEATGLPPIGYYLNKFASSGESNTQVENSPSETQKSLASNNNMPDSEEHPFDGSKYGLTDLTTEEQNKADYYTIVSGDPDVGYNSIIYARKRNGGKPVKYGAKDTSETETAPQTKNNSSNIHTTQVPTGKHWISDFQGVYLWNPEPTGDESISWSGGYVTDGGYKYANGKGTVTWYKNGKIIQVDDGAFI
ncbi:MAG: hypothetical protein IKN43_03285, partial [Selenomonadaceae bacterium]|nr:hypothetical protein [Selenomonadaceae bacterium]